MILEVIATTVTDAVTAEANGADRIELVTGLAEGGLTPSYGLIERTVRSVRIPVQVMIRPHSRSFCYNEEDIETMLNDIRAVKAIGGAGFVFGCLTPHGKIDEPTLRRLIQEAEGADITFHRAFDEADDQEEAFAVLSQYPQIRRILTSGGKPSALEAVGRIRRLVQLSRHSHISIMAGSGLTAQNVADFIRETGVREVHFGTGVRGDKGAADSIEAAKLRAVRGIVDRMAALAD